MNLYNDLGHLTDEAIAALPEELTADQLLDRAEHLASCEACAIQFALCALDCPEPEPVGLTNRMLTTLKEERQKERNGKFANFFKVAVAAVFAVTMFGTGVFTQLTNVPGLAKDAASHQPPAASAAAQDKVMGHGDDGRVGKRRQTLFDGFLQEFDKFAGAVNRIDLGVIDNDKKE